jgi:hypothetical protein
MSMRHEHNMKSITGRRGPRGALGGARISGQVLGPGNYLGQEHSPRFSFAMAMDAAMVSNTVSSSYPSPTMAAPTGYEGALARAMSYTSRTRRSGTRRRSTTR